MNKLLIVAMAVIAVASFSALGVSLATAANSNQEKIGNVPGVIAYQGYLTDNRGGAIADGRHTLTFSLYSTTTGRSAVWTEDQSITSDGGVFSAMLGSNKPFDAGMFEKSPELYLGIAVDGGNEASPRQQLASVPFAIVANSAGIANDLACTGCITTAHLADGVLTTGGTPETIVSSLRSPNGDFYVDVTDEGIFMGGTNPLLMLRLTQDEILIGGEDPDVFPNTRIRISNGDIAMTADSAIEMYGHGQLFASGGDNGVSIVSSEDLSLLASDELSAHAGGKLNLDADLDVDIDAGTGVTANAGTNVTLDGALVRLGGSSGCSPAASLGDQVFAPPPAGIGTITGGNPLVTICD